MPLKSCVPGFGNGRLLHGVLSPRDRDLRVELCLRDLLVRRRPRPPTMGHHSRPSRRRRSGRPASKPIARAAVAMRGDLLRIGSWWCCLAQRAGAHDSTAVREPLEALRLPDVIGEGRQTVSDRLLGNIGRVVLGKREEISLVLSALAAQGHVLLEDVPGTAKTVLARAIAAVDRRRDRVAGSSARPTCSRPTSRASRSTTRRRASSSSGPARSSRTSCSSTRSTARCRRRSRRCSRRWPSGR